MVPSQDEIGLLQSLLPGFLACAVLNSVVPRQNRVAILLLVEALAFTVLIGFFTDVIFRILGRHLDGPSDDQFYKIVANISIAMILPLIVAASINHDIHMRLLRFLRVTRRTARGQVWYDAFWTYSGRYVVVKLRNGKTLNGWPQFYSDFLEEGSLFLNNPHEISDDGQARAMDEEGILLMRDEILSIAFVPKIEVGAAKERAACSWFRSSPTNQSNGGQNGGKRSGYNPPPPKRESPAPSVPPQPKKG